MTLGQLCDSLLSLAGAEDDIDIFFHLFLFKDKKNLIKKPIGATLTITILSVLIRWCNIIPYGIRNKWKHKGINFYGVDTVAGIWKLCLSKLTVTITTIKLIM